MRASESEPAGPQSTSSVLMIRPRRFGSNPETSATNAFQAARGGGAAVLERARAEFDTLVRVLRANDVDVRVLEDTAEPEKPDAVFPNNWVSFHAGGTVVLYPLLAPNRRAEVRSEILDELARGGALALRRLLDLRARAGGAFLEGTGSLVLDRVQRVAYACLSARTSAGLVAEFCRELGYEALPFHAHDADGKEIYHTNVMMSVGTRFAVLCAESMRDAGERRRVSERLAATGHELVTITREQMGEFAGNVLELRSRSGRALLVLSARARRALRPEQLSVLERHATLVSADLETIETHGGGSARCMIAELF